MAAPRIKAPHYSSRIRKPRAYENGKSVKSALTIPADMSSPPIFRQILSHVRKPTAKSRKFRLSRILQTAFSLSFGFSRDFPVRLFL